MWRHTFPTTIEVDMKTLLTALACIPLLVACNKDAPEPVTPAPVATPPVASAPVEAPTPAAVLVPEAPATETTPAASSSASGSSAAGMTASGGEGTYVVDKGDTLWSIAEKNNIQHGDLAKWNNINDPRELQIGRKLTLSAP
jgi:LysM repeat protein